MLEARTYKTTFHSAPRSVTSLVATFLEPTLIVLVFVITNLAFNEPIEDPSLTLCFLVFALTFPGRNLFHESLLAVAVDIVSSWAMVLGILALYAFATRGLSHFNHNVLLAWAVATPLLHLAAVWAGTRVLRWQALKPEARRSTVVVGAGQMGVRVVRALVGGEDSGVDFIGYFDDRADGRLHEDALPHLLGGLRDVAGYVLAHRVREVYITLPLGSQPRIVELLEQLQGTTASLFFVPDVFGISIIQGRLQDVRGVPVVGILETPFTGTNKLVKRVSDIVLALIILVLISPILLAVAIGVKLSSSGPVIFKQRRHGLAGDEIVVYKFRSMRTMEDGATFRQATKDDPRVTKFGAFIRRTSLDELPQFFNVLQGRMSIVGPRPHPIAANEEYRRFIKAYSVRHKVKPGITGWAQINGHRGETDTLDKMRSRVEYDLEYLANWSLRLDLQIIARTIVLVFFDSKAY